MKAAAFIVALAVLQVLASGWWMHANGFFSRPPFHDAGWFRVDAQLMVDRASAEGLPGLFRAAFDHARPHPPLLPWLAAVSAWCTDGAVDAFDQWAAQQVFTLLLSIACYRLARNFGGRVFATIAAASMTTIPVLLVSSRGVMPKFAMTACALLAFDALLRSDGLRRTGAAVRAGAFIGLSMLTMMLAPLYVAGAGLVVFGHGLRRRGTRGRVLLNSALAALAVALTAGWWYARHYRLTLNYAKAVTGAEGQAVYSAGVGPWSLARWTYYPTQLVNNGLGAAVAATVVVLGVVALASWIVRTRRSRPAGVAGVADVAGVAGVARSAGVAGAALTATVLLAFVVVTRGQTAGESQYAMPWAPLLMLFACTTLRDLAPRPRLAGALVLGAAQVFCAGVALRDFEHDLATAASGKVQWIGQADYYLAESARKSGGYPRPDAEVWPLAEFTDLMAAASPDGRIRFGAVAGHHHPFVNGGNLWFTALRRGLTFEARSLRGLPEPTPAQLNDFVGFVDFMVLDAEKHDGGFEQGQTRKLVDRLTGTGVVVETLAIRRVTPKSELRLLRLRKPDAAVDRTDETALEAPSVRRVDVAYENGWRLVGVAPAPSGAQDFFFKSEASATSGYECFVHFVQDGAVRGGRERALVPSPPGGPAIVRLRFAPPSGLLGADFWRFGLRKIGGTGNPEDHARVTASDLPREGRFLSRLASGGASTPTTATRVASRPSSREAAR